jgi:hypothetical protein
MNKFRGFAERYITGSSKICTFIEHYRSDEIEDTRMERTFSTHGNAAKAFRIFVENLKGGGYLEDYKADK